MESDVCDVVVVGGGPVGLYAGYRGALLGLNVHIIDKGRKWSRGFHVPKYHNIPTHFGGMSGKEVIKQLRANIESQDQHVEISDLVTVTEVTRDGDTFRLRGTYGPTGEEREYAGRTVILATGVVDRQPIIGGEMKNIFPYANRGLICYCEICDGHLVGGKRMAIIGSGKMAVQLAQDMFDFGASSVTLFTNGDPLEVDEGVLRSLGVEVFTDEIESLFGAEEGFFGVNLPGGNRYQFDLAFSAMGIYHINNELAVSMGGQLDEDGYVNVDGECRVLDDSGSPIPGLYAVGDLNYNWNQVMIGFGDADRAIVHVWAEYL